jgi:hypothetical protein
MNRGLMAAGENGSRPTPRWVFWLFGIVGGLAVAVIAFIAGDDADETRQNATAFGTWSVRLMVVAVILAGGWGALRGKGTK